jgi:hypothetical protein
MDGSPTAAVPRLVRRIWPRRNMLMRRVDWIEVVLRLAVLTVAIVLVPIALTLGSETYASQVRAGEEQSRARHQATATLIQDAPGAPGGIGGESTTSATSATGRSAVRARWRLPNGTERFGTVQVPDGLRNGTDVSIWLDEAGNPAAEPLRPDRAAAGGIVVAVGSWTIGVGLLIALLVIAHILMNRRRAEGWRRAWARVEPDWSHRPT